MARKKRDLATVADPPATAPSKRQKKEVDAIASSSRPSRTSLAAEAVPRQNNSAASKNTKKGVGRPRKAYLSSVNSSAPLSSRSSLNGAFSIAKNTAERPRRTFKGTSVSAEDTPTKMTVPVTKSTRGRKKAVSTETAEDENAAKTKISVDVPKSQAAVHDAKEEHERELEESIGGDGPSYWLMKAEPESRMTEVRCPTASVIPLQKMMLI